MKTLLAALTFLALTLPAAAQINCPNGFTGPGFGNGNVNGSQVCGVNSIPYPAGQPFGVASSNGNMSGSNIVLIPYPGGHAASSLMYQTPVNVQAFTTTFTFIPDGKNIAITWNNTNNQGANSFQGAQFDGGAGCESGFYQAFTNPEINNVFALQLDSSGPSLSTAPGTFTYSSTQIYSAQQSPCIPPYTGSDGVQDFTPSKISTSPVPIGNSPANAPLTTNGHTYSATITYDGSNVSLDLSDATVGGAHFTHTWPNVNIPSLVGGNTAYVGITGGTNGDNTGPLTIKSLVYTAGSAPPPPPPTTVATPTFNPVAGTYTSTQTVAISDTTSGASIYYTTNGTVPTTSSTRYTGPITVSASETIDAIAVDAGDTNSAEASAIYVITIPPPATVATPSFNPVAGTYTSPQTVTISDTTAGASIFYSLNGGMVAAYSGPLSVSLSEALSAYATAPGDTESAAAAAAYTISIPVQPQTLTITAQSFPITIQTSAGSITATISIAAQTLTVP